MKTKSRLYATVAAASLLVPEALLAQDLAADAGSKYYQHTAKHLQLGGPFYAFMDIDEDMKSLADMLQTGIAAAQDNGLPIPPGLEPQKIMDALGVGNIKAMGMSSVRKGDLFHNRAFIACEGGQTGFFKMLGGKPAKFTAPQLASNTADLVIEQDLALAPVLDMAEDLIAMLGDPSIGEKFNATLNEPIGPLGLTVGQFIKKMDTKLTLIFDMDAKKKMILPDMPPELEIPHTDGIIALDRVAWMFPKIKEMLLQGDQFKAESGDGFEMFTFAQPLPPELSEFEPVVYFDKKTERLLVSTTPEYLQSALSAANPLSEHAEYQTAMAGLPLEGNGLSYASADSIKFVRQLIEMTSKLNPEGQQELMEKYWDMFLPTAPLAQATVRSNLPEGMLFASNTFDSHKSTMAMLVAYPAAAMMAVAGLPSFQRMNQRAQEQLMEKIEEEAEQPDGPQRPKPQKESSEDRAKNNLMQIAFAGEAYFLDNPKAKEVTYKTLLKEEFVYEMRPALGETYDGLKVLRVGGKLSVKLSNGKAVEYEYPAVTD